MPFAPLTPEQLAALVRLKRAHGAAWKRELGAAWMRASAEPVLHRLRNTHGPAWLDRFTLEPSEVPDFTAHADPALAVPCPS